MYTFAFEQVTKTDPQPPEPVLRLLRKLYKQIVDEIEMERDRANNKAVSWEKMEQLDKLFWDILYHTST